MNEILEMTKVIEKALKHYNIEILNYAKPNGNDCQLSFLYKNNICYITNNGNIYYGNLQNDDKLFIKKVIIYAQRKMNVETTLPLTNINIKELEERVIEKEKYSLLLQIKNQLLLYRENGIYGIIYLLAEQKKVANGYIYTNIHRVNNINFAEQCLASRAKLFVRPYNLFTNDEMKTILYLIDSCKYQLKSSELTTKIQNIEKTILKTIGDNANVK